MTYTQVQRLPLSLMSKLTLSGHTLKSTHCFKTYSHVYRITLSRLAFKCTDELFQELNSSVQINSFTTYPHIQINSFKMRDSEPHCSIIQTNTDIWSIYIYIISNFRSLKTQIWACLQTFAPRQSPCPFVLSFAGYKKYKTGKVTAGTGQIHTQKVWNMLAIKLKPIRYCMYTGGIHNRMSSFKSSIAMRRKEKKSRTKY